MRHLGELTPRRPLAITLALLMALTLFTVGCADSTPTPTPTPTRIPSPFPLTLTDSNGHQMTIEKPPQRIVAIDSAAVEILFALGEDHRVVGTHDFVSYPPETKDIEKIGSAFALNLEKIAALEPDLIYIFFASPLPDLEKLAAQVLYLESPGTLAGVAERMRTWGRIVNNPRAAEELVRQFEESIKSVQERLAAVGEGPRVYHDAAPDLWTAGSDSLSNEIYTLLKAQNVFRDISGFQQVSPEEIVARDPQVIISVHAEGPDLIRGDPAFQGLSAVKEGRLFAIEGDLLEIAGPRLVQGMEQVAQLLYPDLFP